MLLGHFESRVGGAFFSQFGCQLGCTLFVESIDNETHRDELGRAVGVLRLHLGLSGHGLPVAPYEHRTSLKLARS